MVCTKESKMKKLINIYFLIIFIVLSCNQVQVSNINVADASLENLTREILNHIPYVGAIRNDVDGGTMGWESFGTKWDQQVIKYYINYPPLYSNGKYVYNYFNDSDKKYISDKTKAAVAEWTPHIKRIVAEVQNPDYADFTIMWKPLENDGKGKKLAISDGPPHKENIEKPIMIMDMADMYDIVKSRESKRYKYYNVVLHEMGHMLAGLAHDKSRGVMNAAFNFGSLQLDDICGARINYNNFERFDYDGKTYVFIDRRKQNQNLTTNFKVKEILSKCPLSSDHGHFISLNTVNALQYIRTKYECPIRVTSSYRDVNCNKSAGPTGGAEVSQHLFRNALDWKFTGPKAAAAQRAYFQDIMRKGPTLQSLLVLGIRGFGSYTHDNMLNHIDSRSGIAWNTWYKTTGYMTWGKYKGAFSISNEFSIYD